MRVLGIDPGSRLLGYGLISKEGSKLVAHAHGTLRFNTEVEANERLVEIHERIVDLLVTHKPDHVAIEKVFFAKNAVSSFKLGQARGVVILAVMQAGIPMFEYSPNAVKQSVVGFGHADKDQVALMVGRMVGAQKFESSDSSDALAIAICHLHTYSYTQRIQTAAAKADAKGKPGPKPRSGDQGAET